MTQLAIATEESDEVLMAAYASGDEAAFSRLFARVGPKVWAFFLRSFRDGTVADELSQATFLKLHRGRSSYQADLPLRPWLFTIAARVRRDELRRRYRLKEDCDEEGLAAAEESLALTQQQAAEHADPTDTIAQVRAALDQLPELQRVVVHLHRYEGLTFGEIARVLGTSEVAVRGRAFRAYEQLRRILRSVAAMQEEG